MVVPQQPAQPLAATHMGGPERAGLGQTECLDWLLILNRRHLERLLGVYARHYNHQRPHRELNLSTPEERRQLEPVASAAHANVCRRNLLGGLLHEYYQAAA